MRTIAAALSVGSAAAMLAMPQAMAQAPAQAQAYPTKPVRMIIGFPPGQATDIIGRTIADKLSQSLGQQFVVDNRAGASGIIGTELTIKSPADGYTVLMSSSGPLAVNPGLYAKLPYDVMKDLAPISMVATVPLFMAAHPSLPANNIRELIALAKAQPGRINYGSGGSGVTNHLVMEMFKSAVGVDMTHVPYKGGPPAVADLVAGQIQLMFETGPGILPQVRAGKLKAIAAGSIKRSAATPDLPTVAEQGVPGFDGVAWVGFVAPAGTPRAIIDKLNAETRKAVASEDVRNRFLSLGAEPPANSPEEFSAYIRAEMEKWGRVIKASGAKVD
jgi:tripartite-type tricarboxylate transporter receptor subunit TctC